MNDEGTHDDIRAAFVAGNEMVDSGKGTVWFQLTESAVGLKSRAEVNSAKRIIRSLIHEGVNHE